MSNIADTLFYLLCFMIGVAGHNKKYLLKNSASVSAVLLTTPWVQQL